MTTAPTLRLRTIHPDATRAMASAIAGLLRPGDVVALSGELGAGKTCFVQGAAHRLGVDQTITSPTFTLVKTYPQAALPLVHVDVYRLDRLQDVLDLGEEVFAPDVVTFVEWGDAIAPLLPDDHLQIELRHDDGAADGAARDIQIRVHGTFVDRLGPLRSALRDWIEEA